MISHEAVIWLYRCILSREPESEQVIDSMSQAFESIEQGAQALFRSEEFLIRGHELHIYRPENNNAPCPFHLKQKLALAAIMKNEESNIVNMLQSVVPIVGFVSLLDTGSTDSSIRNAKRFLEDCNLQFTIQQFPFNNFAESRNSGLELVPDIFSWIIILDADEFIVSDDYWRLSALLDCGFDGWELPRFNYTDEKRIMPVHPYPDRQRRLIRNRKTNKIRYAGRVHETPEGVETWGQAPIMSCRPGGQRGGPHIHHTGQVITPQRFREKDDFYRELLLSSDV